MFSSQAVAGLLPDGRQIVNRAAEEAVNYKQYVTAGYHDKPFLLENSCGPCCLFVYDALPCNGAHAACLLQGAAWVWLFNT